jgi:hypothetical protein
MLWCTVIYYLLTVFVGKSENVTANNTMSMVLIVVGFSTTVLSFLIKKQFLARAIEQQRVEMVQQGYILAFALTEATALLGLLDFFTTGNRYFYVLILIGAIGQLAHFPRREDVLAASFK